MRGRGKPAQHIGPCAVGNRALQAGQFNSLGRIGLIVFSYPLSYCEDKVG